MRDVADEVGLLSGQRELPFQVQHNQPAADADGQHEQRNQQAEREFQCLGRPGEPRGIQEINRDLPVRQCLPDFGRDERTLPVPLLLPGKGRHGPGIIVQQRNANFAAQRFCIDFHEFLQAFSQARQVDERAEDQLRIARRAIPEHQVEFVLEKAGDCALRRVAHELAELGLGRSDLGIGLLVHRLLRLLRLNVARHFPWNICQWRWKTRGCLPWETGPS